MLNRNQIFFRFVLFSNKAIFHKSGQLNQHKSHYWSVKNPHWYQKLIIAGVSLYGGILNGNLIGPYFFENVNGNNYLHFL